MSSSAAASMTDELEATRQKKRRKKHRERAEVAAASSESPRPPATPYSMLESPAPTAPETLTSTAVAAASPLVEEAVRKEERKKHKRSRYQEEAATPSPSAPATAAQILEMAAARKEQRRGKVEQGQSCQALLPVDVHPQGGGAAAAAYAGVSVSQSAKRCRGGKIPVLSDREILRIRRIELRKQQPMPESFVPAMANPNPIDQDSKYSSPFGAFFDQFCYKPDCQEGRNATSLPKTPDRPARPLPRDHLPSLSSQLTANETFMAAKTTTSNTKQPRSASVSHPQEEAAAAADAGVSVSQSVKRCRGGKIPVLSDHEILRTRRIELRKQQPMPESFVPAMANPNPIDQDSKYSSPFGAFFDQFRYKPDRQEGRNATSLPKTPDRPARPLPRDHPPSLSSQLTANETFMAAKKTKSNTKQPRSASVSHPQEEAAAAADAGVSVSQSVKRCRGGKIPVLSDREILRTGRIELRKQQPMPESFVPTMANPNPIDQDSKYSSPFGAFFDQFRYKPDRQEGRNALSLPKTPDRPVRPLPRDHPPSLSSQLTANETFMAAKTTTSNTKQPRSASVSRPQEEVKVNERKWSEKIISQMKKLRKKSPLLSAAEKRSDKYRRLPLNQLVCPPRSRYNLLQEKYASDPWKVIVICMLLNLTKGDQVKRKLEGFFERYPDARTAYTADPEKMAKYLAPLGLQRVKANRIQRFSRAYVEEEWTYITELCGVGKYAADAYAIFCAGRATEVVPEDHKLVVYWKFVCKLSLTQASQNEQEAAGATRL